MPALVPLIPAGLGAFGAISATTAFVLTASSSLAIGLYESNRAKRKARDAYNDSLTDRLVSFRSGVAARQYVLGRCRVAGAMLYGDSVGTNKTALDIVVALAANKCSLVGHYMDDEYIAEADFPGDKYGKLEVLEMSENFTVTGPSDSVDLTLAPMSMGTTRAYYIITGNARTISISSGGGSTINLTGMPAGPQSIRITYKSASSVKLRSYFLSGSDSQAAHSWGDVTTPLWTSYHRLRGVTALRTLYFWDEDIYAERGAPQHAAVLDGGSLDTHEFYDPRDDSNPTYTDNPALLALWWATLPRSKGGCGIPLSWIDLDFVSEAANVCDETITVVQRDGTGYEDIKRYQFHGVLSTENAPRSNLDLILGAMAGKFLYTAGQYRMRAGAFYSADKTITDADVVGTSPISVATGGDISISPNIVTASFADADQNWQETSPSPVVNAAYVTADGHEDSLDLRFPGCTDARQAHYLMGVALEDSRPAMSLTLRVGGIGEDMALLDTVQLDLVNRSSYAGRTFVVVGRVDLWDGNFDLELREIRSSTYALDPDSFTPITPATVADNSYLWNVTDPTGFDVTQNDPQILPDGTALARLDLAWDTPTQDYLRQGGQHNLRYRRMGSDGAWITLPSVPGDAESTTVTAALAFDDYYQFQLQAQNGLGARSAWVDAYELIDGSLLPSASQTAQVTIFKRSASAPSVPSTTSTYTFATAILTEHDNGWTQSAPAHDGNPLYMTTATALGTDPTDDIATGEWATPQIQALDGTDGSDGVDGSDGADGADGADGTNGTNGTNGADGADGADGTDGIRGSASFFGFSGTSGTGFSISGADVTAFAGTLTDAVAAEVAALIMSVSSDGYITPGDYITMSDGASTAAMRIYQGSRTNAYAGVTAAMWSAVVVQVFDGSVIVQGTLVANRFLTDQGVDLAALVTNQLNIKRQSLDAGPTSVTASATTSQISITSSAAVDGHKAIIRGQFDLQNPGPNIFYNAGGKFRLYRRVNGGSWTLLFTEPVGYTTTDMSYESDWWMFGDYPFGGYAARDVPFYEDFSPPTGAVEYGVTYEAIGPAAAPVFGADGIASTTNIRNVELFVELTFFK